MSNPKSTSSILVSNTSYLVGAEIVAKGSRLFSIMAMAVYFTPTEYGAVMLALTIHEVLRLLLRSGAGVQIIRASDESLPLFLGNGLLIQWLLCTSLCLIQIAIGWSAQWAFPEHDIFALVALMALTYLAFPAVSTRVFLLQRSNRMGLFSLISSACIIVENVTIAVALYFDAHMMAVVIAKWCFALLWLACFSFVPCLSHELSYHKDTFRLLLKSSSQLAISEILRSLRINMDTFIAARLLTPELFGIYSFAKSAGIGLAMSISQAYTSALYPFICRRALQNNSDHNSQKLIFITTFAVSSIFMIQALAVPVYVPILFSSQWQSSFDTTSLLCLVAVSSVWVDTYTTVLRSEAQYKRDCHFCVFALVVSLLSVAIVMPSSPVQLAVTLLGGSIVWLLFPLADITSRYLQPDPA
ncbi:oligosaccharide flippase family protein [Pseudoalteromonas peptidolytica]|uniref:oligosaccharide flippase family protein n=1 Tax=Pseudoalteromonas peptidolytica TaxID=61150 RepID=UPI00298D8BB6|nr:oligosaccharide flippase family protein [Pseudoalteromonas peptidolytica]MDW7549540.1 oligosaccharide flippase family protein [Pseudoalteromonas peptidolytica]